VSGSVPAGPDGAVPAGPDGAVPAGPDDVLDPDDIIPAGAGGEGLARPDGAADYRPIALVDLLDRVLAKGVVVSGELALSIADVDLVYVSLRALLASVRAGTIPPSSREEDTR
jgi:hypothetical protein